jgi:hypothetical protein
LTVVVETGKGLFHTEVGKLQRTIRLAVQSGQITSESELLLATRAAYFQAAQITNTTVNPLALDTALLSGQATINTSLTNTAAELSTAGKASATTLGDVGAAVDRSFGEIMQGAGKVAETAKVEQAAASTVATAAKAEITVAAGVKTLSTAGKFIAPVAKTLAPLAPAARALGKVAGPVGIALTAVQVATAKTTDEKIDAGISTVSTALMMSKHPVAMAGGAGLAAGQLIEKTLDVSSYSSAHGVATYEGLKKMGANDTFSFVAGGVVTVASTPVAITEAAIDKSAKLAGRAWNWLSN